MTIIEITPPGGNTDTIRKFISCSATLSSTGRTGNFAILLPSWDNDIFDKYPVGSDVRINQDGNIFRGWILNPSKQIDGQLKAVSITGMCYTGRTQKIMVTEVYINQKISDIVKDLFTKYAPEFNLDSIAKCDKIISLKINDIFLFDVIEELAALAGYEWFIDEPVPEEIDTLSHPAGWQELIETKIHKVFYPSETLYPSEHLYPC